jgi:hypothetical protein
MIVGEASKKAPYSFAPFEHVQLFWGDAILLSDIFLRI